MLTLVGSSMPLAVAVLAQVRGAALSLARPCARRGEVRAALDELALTATALDAHLLEAFAGAALTQPWFSSVCHGVFLLYWRSDGVQR